jgi:hypothetical protein
MPMAFIWCTITSSWAAICVAGTALFAMVKAAVVFGGTLVLSWIAVLAVQRISFGAQLIGARDERSQRRNRLARRARATKI